MDKKASSYLSQLKVIATFLVVLVHSRNLLGYATYTNYNPLISFGNIFATAGILVFFVVSGYLLFRKEFCWFENLKKKCRTLLIPFFTWNIFWILLEFLGMSFLPAYFEGNIGAESGGGLMALLGIPFGKAPFYTPLWFVRDLFLLNLLAPVLKWVIDRFPVWLTLLILAGIWLIPLPYDIWYFMCQGIVFFTLGGLIARNKIFFVNNSVLKTISILSLTLISIAACIPGVNMWSYYSRFMLILAMVVICMAPVVFNLKWLEVFVPYSFMIYVLHGKPLSVLQILYARLIPQNDLTIFIGYLIIPVVIIVLCIAVAYILKHFVPRLYAILMGSR